MQLIHPLNHSKDFILNGLKIIKTVIGKVHFGESVAQWLEFSLLVHEVPGSNPGWGKLAGIFTLGLKCLKLIGNICRSYSNSCSPPCSI